MPAAGGDLVDGDSTMATGGQAEGNGPLRPVVAFIGQRDGFLDIRDPSLALRLFCPGLAALGNGSDVAGLKRRDAKNTHREGEQKLEHGIFLVQAMRDAHRRPLVNGHSQKGRVAADRRWRATGKFVIASQMPPALSRNSTGRIAPRADAQTISDRKGSVR